MNEFIENITANLDTCGELTEVLLNAISLLFIILGVIISVVESIKAPHARRTSFAYLFQKNVWRLADCGTRISIGG